MPKIAKERTQNNQRRIEAAALELFTTQGFHGTNNRDIAKKIGTSTGSIYTYFASKEAIFATLAKKYQSHLDEWRRKAFSPLKSPLSREGIKAMASAIQSAMYEEPEYFLLVLSDIIEFKNRHFQKVFHDVPQQLRRVMGPAIQGAKNQPGWRGQDPVFVVASMYTYFFTYFLMERYMQGEQHLGVSDEEATEAFIDLLLHGLWRSVPQASPADSSRKNRNDVATQKRLHQAEQDRIAYIRFLSGRLWDLPPDLPPTQSQDSNGNHPARRSILFLPELPRKRIDENQLRIEAAALEFFTKQGFHGTNIRDVAEKAGVSQGAIYSYYPSKEAIFEGLVKSYRHAMRQFLERVFRALEDPFSERDLRFFAAAMRSLVYDDAEYWLLMYIDVVEFKNRHFLTAFQDVPMQFRRLLGPAIDTIRKQPGWCGHDPALVMAMVFFYFHTYFVIERVMHGNHHLGVSDDEAVERFVDILSHGLLLPEAHQSCAPHIHRARTHGISRASPGR
ncbi:MAG TPA: TetR/AcrR family transcriptional regulator [Candidatus Angelobacter sp.]